MSNIALCAITAIVSSNIISATGIGAVSLQTEKRSFSYMLVSSLCTIITVVLAGLLFFLINTFVLVPLNAEAFKLFIVMLLTLVISYVTRIVLKRASKEQFFLYEKSYNFTVQIIVSVGTLLMIEFTSDFLMLVIELAMYSAGFMIVQIIFSALYDKLDNTHAVKPARNVPLMLYTLSILSMIMYAVGLIF